MSLGPQCRACRQRRVRCDSTRPACFKCSRKGIECPGYSTSRALRWRHYVSRNRPEDEGVLVIPMAPDFSSSCARADDIAPWDVVRPTVDYYNAKIVPDLSACDTSAFRVDPAEWLTFGLMERHLRLCVVALHKAVRQIADDQWDLTVPQTLRKYASQEMVMFHHHQACAAGILQQQIDHLRDNAPDDALVAGTIMFLSSQIQESAYGAWNAHLTGVNIMVDRRLRVATEPSDAHEKLWYFHVLVIDVYSRTTSSARLWSASDMAQHSMYLNRMRHLNYDGRNSMTPIPDEIVLATVAINMLRARRAASPSACAHEERGAAISPAALLASIRAFNPRKWSRSGSGCSNYTAAASADLTASQTDLEGWTLLATCFQAAAVMYLILSTTLHNGDYPFDGRDRVRDSAYAVLVASIQKLFERKASGGKHHQFILWPVVIAGVEVVARGDRNEFEYLSSHLKTLTTDLGTMAMREAAFLLERLWDDCARARLNSSKYIPIDWDSIFEAGPVFLL